MLTSRAPHLILVLLLSGCVSGSYNDNQTVFFMEQDRLAVEYYESKRFIEALEIYSMLTRKIPKEYRYWFHLGNCHARLGHTQEAISAYREALIRKPNFTKAWYNIAYLQAADLSATAAEMYRNVDRDDPNFNKIEILVEEVLRPFNRHVQADKNEPVGSNSSELSSQPIEESHADLPQ